MPIDWHGSTALEEMPDSPVWEFGDTIQATAAYRGPHALCLSSAPRKGAFGTGDYAGLRVSKSTVQKERGGIGRLTVIYEGVQSPAGESQLPPDEADLEYAQQEFDLRRHPKYQALSSEDWTGINAFVEAGDPVTAQELADLGSDPLAANAILKLQKGNDHFVLFPPVYRWTSYSLDEPWSDGGGYIEDPWGPISFPLDYFYLRAGDSVSFNGTYWKITRTWIGAFEWPEDLYPLIQ